ncbi:hypothetical protein EUGRSUZ_B02857 [Eucalyptus grandis]|uniref:Uncharacterized protein n=2 Tax=Eucalyptus grandis TaxID=71139 RepID=A0ACC3LUG7_EUCGR|nr:hypothetical protein EUGRSUZ_B02857 [Eucalyptus grandis]
MEMVRPTAYYESLKRYWRRRRYQKLSGSPAKRSKLKVLRLGGSGSGSRHHWKVRTAPKLRWKMAAASLFPVKLLAKFHNGYIDMMIGLACSVVKSSSGAGIFRGKRITRESQKISVVSTGEEVDGKFVVEAYKKLAASRQLMEL